MPRPCNTDVDDAIKSLVDQVKKALEDGKPYAMLPNQSIGDNSVKKQFNVGSQKATDIYKGATKCLCDEGFIKEQLATAGTGNARQVGFYRSKTSQIQELLAQKRYNAKVKSDSRITWAKEIDVEEVKARTRRSGWLFPNGCLAYLYYKWNAE